MTRFNLRIKTPFGALDVSGETPSEIINILNTLNEEFLVEVHDIIMNKLARHEKDSLKGVVEILRNGPIITTKRDITHYEAIGLILYSLKKHQASSRQLRRQLADSGMKVMVPARIHEMRKRGHVFKPIDKEPYYKLSSKGLSWMDAEVIPKLAKH